MRKNLILVVAIVIGCFSIGYFHLKNIDQATLHQDKKEKIEKNEGGNEMDEQEVIDLYRKVNEAMVAKDIDTLTEILSDDMHLIHMTGYDHTKKEWLAQIESEQMRYFSSEEETIKDIQIEGNHASFIGQNKVDARIYGSRNTWNLEMNMMFEKVAGTWMIVWQEASTY